MQHVQTHASHIWAMSQQTIEQNFLLQNAGAEVTKDFQDFNT